MKTPIEELRQRHAAFAGLKMSHDMTRGKPSPEQLELSIGMLTLHATKSPMGINCLNYGGLEGLPEARAYFARYLGVHNDEVIVGGNSSLALMHDVMALAVMKGICGLPWKATKFLCPVPGYDRHFAICEKFGLEMIPVPMTACGPDMGTVKELVRNPAVGGIWCVPQYSNPTGITYSDATVRELATMRTENPRFRIFWDNAYAVHDLTDDPDHLLNILDACTLAHNNNRPFIFGSTSKITFAGSGVAAVAMSAQNLKWFLDGLAVQTIGPDKLNQLRHVVWLKNKETTLALMQRHREILEPKFLAVDEMLQAALGGKDIATWTKPNGGYFVSLNVPGCAKRVVELAAQAGVKLTPAGATFPYGKDPDDSNIRIAPSFPSVGDVQAAMEVVALCVELAHAEKENK